MLRAVVDGVEALLVDDLRHPHQQGAVGLWIGDGTRGLFKNLNVVSQRRNSSRNIRLRRLGLGGAGFLGLVSAT